MAVSSCPYLATHLIVTSRRKRTSVLQPGHIRQVHVVPAREYCLGILVVQERLCRVQKSVGKPSRWTSRKSYD